MTSSLWKVINQFLKDYIEIAEVKFVIIGTLNTISIRLVFACIYFVLVSSIKQVLVSLYLEDSL